jgi:hypothetical protein
MSFGYSAGEIIGLTQLAWQIVQNTRRACGEHDELTHEISSLHAILLRLQHSASSAEPSLNPHNNISTQVLRHVIDGLQTVLLDLDEILEEYNALSESKRATTRLWSKIRFGNGPMLDLGQIRMKVVTHMTVINAHVNVGMSEDIRKMQGSLEKIAGNMAGGEEGTVLTNYDGDDKAAWRELRRELRGEGFEDSSVRERKESIIKYIKELGRRGFFDLDEMNIASSSQHPGTREPLCNTAATPLQNLEDPLHEESFSDDDELSRVSVLCNYEDDKFQDEDYSSDESEQDAIEPDVAESLQRNDANQSMNKEL